MIHIQSYSVELEQQTCPAMSLLYLNVKLKPQERKTLWRLNVIILNYKLVDDIKTYPKENDKEVNPSIL